MPDYWFGITLQAGNFIRTLGNVPTEKDTRYQCGPWWHSRPLRFGLFVCEHHVYEPYGVGCTIVNSTFVCAIHTQCSTQQRDARLGV